MIDPVVGSALTDQYLIEREIAAGGMGTVYLARDLRHGRRVAVKVMNPIGAAGTQQVLTELRNAARLQHPHILPVYDSGEAAGRTWLVTPFMSEGSLREVLATRGRLPIREVLPLLTDIGAAVQYAHDHQILHGDIKPENILLDQGHAYLADFGISRAIHADWSAIRARPPGAGTPDYVSPEQAAGGSSVDGRADLYSLACVAVELLSGRAPFVADTPTRSLAKRYLAPPDVRALVPELPYAAAQVLERALALDPVRRQSSVRAFLAELETSLQGHRFARLGRGWRGLIGAYRRGSAGALGAWAFDLRSAIRSLRRRPGFSLTVAGTLALALGALTATMAVVDGILLRSLPYRDPDRLVALCELHPSLAQFCVASPPNATDWERRSKSFSAFGLGRDWGFTLTRDGKPVGLSAGLASDGLFRVFQLEPLLGRLIQPEDLAAGRRVAVLSHGLWASTFGADSSIVGRGIVLDDSTWTVVGVLRPAASVPLLETVQLWAPLPFRPDDPSQRDWRGFRTYARLMPGVSVEAAGDDLRRIARDLGRDFPASNEGWGVEVRTLHDEVVGPVRLLLLVFLSATGLVLVVAAANIANLMLARASGRARELAIQAAVGGGRARLVRTLLLESLVIALVGIGLGVIVARSALAAFLHFAPTGVPRLENVGLGGGPLAVGAMLGLLVAFLAGLVPVLRMSRLDLSIALRGAGADSGPERGWGRAALVVTQVAVAVTLLTAAGLLTRSFVNLIRWRPGFETEHLVVVWTSASPGRFTRGADVALLQRQAREIIGGVAGVTGVANVSNGPLFGGIEPGTFVSREEGPRREVAARWYDASPGYFETLGLPLVRGRAFTAADVPGSTPVAVVNETFARRLWPGADPIGRRVAEDRPDATVLEVVGVVQDITPFRAGEPPVPGIWWPYDQAPRWGAYLVLRTAVPPVNLVPAIEERLEATVPGLQLGTFRTMPELISARLVTPRFNLVLIAGFATLALLMAVVGLYGLVSFLVALRLRELAIRMALGASGIAVRRQVFARSLRLALVGVGIGLVGAVALGRLLRTLLAGVSPLDPATLTLVPVVLLACVVLATWQPARRASRADPMTLLRAE
ncbi:MAG TPA: ADOP family duplicated permease [Gemmatimonadales bacterium]